MAETVGGNVPDVLAGLVRHNLVRALPGEAPRFALLRTIRSYASDRLREARREAKVRARHAQRCVDPAENLTRTPGLPD